MARNGAIGTRYIGLGWSAAPGVVPALIWAKSRPRAAGTNRSSTAMSLLPVAAIPSMCQTSNTVGVGQREQEPAGVARVRRVDAQAHRPVGVHHARGVAPATGEPVAAVDRLGASRRHRAGGGDDVGLAPEDLLLHALGVQRQQQVVLHAERGDPARRRARFAERQHLVDEVHDTELQPAVATGHEVVEHTRRVEPGDHLVVRSARRLGGAARAATRGAERGDPSDEHVGGDAIELGAAEAVGVVRRDDLDHGVAHGATSPGSSRRLDVVGPAPVVLAPIGSPTLSSSPAASASLP